MKKTLSIFTRPVPMWLFALWIAGGMSVAALAAVPLYTGSISVPATGTNTENQLSASQCIGTDASKVEKSNSNCVQSLTGTANRVTVSGSTGAITLNGPQDIATSSSPTFSALTLSTGPLQVGSNGGNVTNAVAFGNPAHASTGNTQIYSNNGVTIAGVTATLFGVSDTGVSAVIACNVSGSCGFNGSLSALGGVKSASDGVTASYVGPAYTTAGAAVASTLHKVVLSGVGPSGTSTCLGTSGYCSTISLTGAAQFASGGSSSTAPSFECGGGWVYRAGITSFVTYSSYGLDLTFVGIAAGTPNTVYVVQQAASNPFYVVCEGT